MNPTRPAGLMLCLIVGLGLTACTAAAQREASRAGTSSARVARRSLPASSRGAGLRVGADARNLPGHRVNLEIHLLARRVFRGVRVAVSSSDPKLTVPSGCSFEVVTPPTGTAQRPFTTPLPAVPLCSLVLSARMPGTYPIDVRVLDGGGTFLAPTLFLWVRIN